jgi:hypothetical protein
MKVLPRLLRFRDAPGYLGMDRNRFNAEVRPGLTEIPIGVLLRPRVQFKPIECDPLQSQRAVLDEANKIAAGRSLIPPTSNYREHLKAYRAECQRVGINGAHDLRHRYAQTRYFEKAGWHCPARGGPTKKELTPEQRSIDQRVRLEISLELGHGRGQVTATYLGR